MKSLIRVVLSSLVVLALPAALSANTIYEYEGGAFGNVGGVYAVGDRITGMLELSDSFAGPPCPLCAGIGDVTPGITRYSFTDGHQTFTEANSTGYFELKWRGGPVLPARSVPPS